ncbi:hypothetical protein BFW38_05825 [Terasakiispira papahanaumokuakeensis]|uniref:Sel1 repeat family protein n=1 Tax=Terasakiispira papahanaumokuakeensis TaxID=197479 RepID=A0A1E2V885_9GAMM|nr:tetratricopeptide repeat protein [Terasakiispira papahanaumokuakeensis]ODC03133.1 hypothetical protein BFW38_05825 [Terasakiispira papahanaumokuakeensis]
MLKTFLKFELLCVFWLSANTVFAGMEFYGDDDGVIRFSDYLTSDSFYLSDVTLESSNKQLYAAGFCYLHGCSEIGNDVDVSKAVDYIGYAKERGVDDVYFDYAYMYLKGIHYSKNISEGMRFLKKSAEKGDVRSLVTLGNFYSDGFRTITVDREEGFKWYYIAAEKGVKKAMSKVYYYYSDESHPETFDLSKAFYWAKKIEEVHPDDIGRYTFKLGEIYEKGLGTQKNLILATRYYILGGSAGSDDVARLREKMTEEEFQEAVRLANEWQAEHRIRVPRYYQ